MLRLYLDHDSASSTVVAALRLSGIDVLTTQDAGNARADDATQLAFAAGTERALYTDNVSDFARLQAGWVGEGRPHGGIIVRANQAMTVSLQIRALQRISTFFANGATDLFIYLDSWLHEEGGAASTR